MFDTDKPKRDTLPPSQRRSFVLGFLAAFALMVLMILSGLGGARLMGGHIASLPTATPYVVLRDLIITATPPPPSSVKSPATEYYVDRVRHVDVPCSQPERVPLELEKGGVVTFDCAATVQFDRQIEVSSNTTFIGRSPHETILAGAGQLHSLFHVVNGLFTFRNATIAGATEGAVYVDGSAHFENCEFADNTRSISTPSMLGVGAALIVTGKATLEDCTFRNNQSPFGGAAIHVVSSYGVSAEVIGKKLTFLSNEATSSSSLLGGGAIYNMGHLSLTEAVFRDSKAKYGAAIYNSGTLMIDDALFAMSMADSPAYGNGVIANADTGTLTIKNLAFSDSPGAKTDIYNLGTLNNENTLP